MMAFVCNLLNLLVMTYNYLFHFYSWLVVLVVLVTNQRSYDLMMLIN